MPFVNGVDFPQLPPNPAEWMTNHDSDGLQIEAIARTIPAICADFHSRQLAGRVSASNILMDVAIRKMDEALDISGFRQMLVYINPLFALDDEAGWTIDHVIPVHQLKTLLYGVSNTDGWEEMALDGKVAVIVQIVHAFFWRAFIPKKLNTIVSVEHVPGSRDRKLGRWMPNYHWLTDPHAQLARYEAVHILPAHFELAREVATPWDNARLKIEHQRLTA